MIQMYPTGDFSPEALAECVEFVSELYDLDPFNLHTEASKDVEGVWKVWDDCVLLAEINFDVCHTES